MATIADRIVLSPNFIRAPINGRTVIIHATRSGISNFAKETQATINEFLKPNNTSAHWVVGRDGEKIRMVPDDCRAAHAQEDNDNAWGIEVCQGVESDGFTDAQYDAVAAICRDTYMANFNVPAVHARTSTEPGFIGHEETAQGIRNGKSDPGRLWDWARFIGMLAPPIQAQVEESLEMVWMALKDKPADVIFRSYLGWTDSKGLHSRFVPDFGEHQALEESRVAGPLQFVSIETLRQFKASPDPLG